MLPTVDEPAPPAATALTAAVSPARVVYGQPATMSGRLTAGGTGVAGKVVTLEARCKGTTTWTSLGTATSAADGALRTTFTPTWTAALRWRWPGDAAYAGSVSPGTSVTVYGKVLSALSMTSMRLGSTARITGSVAPAHPGGPYALDRYVSGAWKPVGTYPLSPTSKVSRYVQPPVRGTYYYRVRWLGDTDHAARTGRTLVLKVT